MTEATAWIYFATALLGFLAAAITAIRAIIRWGAARGILRLILSLSFDVIGFVAWIMAAVAGFSGWGLSATWCFAFVFMLSTIVGFAINPRTLTRVEIALFCFMLMNAVMFVVTFVILDFEHAKKSPLSSVPAATSRP